jgi:hypothetical protein
MSDIQINILKIEQFLENKLEIPEYQRPYKWNEKNINHLIDDILHFNQKDSYRIGTIVLHKNNNKLDIVDGQQRTISLLLLYYAIKEDNKLQQYLNNTDINLNFEFTSEISHLNIQNNYQLIKRRLKEFDEKSVKFLFEKCEIVKVTLHNLTEAFQFFDSQNARGKDLEPHDLLKAFHLRAMQNISEIDKTKLIKSWEEIKTDELANLFSNYLYRIKNWSRLKSARNFNKNKIDVFKGINLEKNHYNYSKIYSFTNNYTKENNLNYPFGLEQIVINGKIFFEMIIYYKEKLEELKELESPILNLLDTYDGKKRTGDKYVRNLFDCALFFYIDKFGETEIDRAIEKFFIWAYKVRLELQSVQLASVDNYARDSKMFYLIKESITHKEIINLQLPIVKEIKATKIDELKNKFEELHYVK